MPVALDVQMDVNQRGGSVIGPEILQFFTDEELAFLVRITERGQEIQRRLENNEPTIDIDDPRTGQRRAFYLDVVSEKTKAAIAAASS
jgi:hypothetical protein